MSRIPSRALGEECQLFPRFVGFLTIITCDFYMDPKTKAARGCTGEWGSHFPQEPLSLPTQQRHHTSFQMAGHFQVSLPLQGKKLGGSHLSPLPRAVTT